MKIFTPQVSKLIHDGIFVGRKPQAVFVRKHNQ